VRERASLPDLPYVEGVLYQDTFHIILTRERFIGMAGSLASVISLYFGRETEPER